MNPDLDCLTQLGLGKTHNMYDELVDEQKFKALLSELCA